MKFQMQPTHNTCTSTCIAMILGVPAQQVIDEFHDDFMAYDVHHFDYLKSKGFNLRMGECRELIEGPGLYFLSVPSLNIVGGAHSIIYYIKPADPDGFFHYVFDPVEGREGKKYYKSGFYEDDSPLAVNLGFYQIDFVVLNYEG